LYSFFFFLKGSGLNWCINYNINNDPKFKIFGWLIHFYKKFVFQKSSHNWLIHLLVWLYLKYKHRNNYNIINILFHNNWYSAFQVMNSLTFKPEKLSIFYISCKYYYNKLSYPVRPYQFFDYLKAALLLISLCLLT